MIVAAVLAAGFSRRLGCPKALVVVDGVPLVVRAVAAASAPEIDEVAVVLGRHAHASGIESVLPSRVTRLESATPEEGMASSVRAAAAWAEQRHASALVLLLVDQPRVDALHVGRLVAGWRGGALAAASGYGGVAGAPAIFDARVVPELRALAGDRGASAILRGRRAGEVVVVPCAEAELDIDTTADLDALGTRDARCTRHDHHRPPS